MEVSQRTSATSTVDLQGNAEAYTPQMPFPAGHNESALEAQQTEKAGRDDFGRSTLTAQGRSAGKAPYTKKSDFLDIKEEKGEGSSQGCQSVIGKLRLRFGETINHEDATIPLAWQALLTGLIDALLYTRGTIWTGFQTGRS